MYLKTAGETLSFYSYIAISKGKMRNIDGDKDLVEI
jgi:hypothetical protein